MDDEAGLFYVLLIVSGGYSMPRDNMDNTIPDTTVAPPPTAAPAAQADVNFKDITDAIDRLVESMSQDDIQSRTAQINKDAKNFEKVKMKNYFLKCSSFSMKFNMCQC